MSALFNAVLTRIRPELYAGSKKGADATLREAAGNDFDTASLLLSLLRAGNIHCPRHSNNNSTRMDSPLAPRWTHRPQRRPCRSNPKGLRMKHLILATAVVVTNACACPGSRIPAVAPPWIASIPCGATGSHLLVSNEVTVEDTLGCLATGRCETSNALDRSRLGTKTGANEASNWSAGRMAHPINMISQPDAKRVCRGLGGRLPTLAEMRCISFVSQPFPWGSTMPGPNLLNYGDRDFLDALESTPGVGRELAQALRSKHGAGAFVLRDGAARTAAIASFPAGRSPSGLADLFGNVEEWTQSPEDRSADDSPTAVLFGGSYATPLPLFTTPPETTEASFSENPTVGFRCVQEQ